MHRMVRRVASPQWRHKRAAEAGYLLLAHRVECLSVRIARRNGFLCHHNTFSLCCLCIYDFSGKGGPMKC